MYLLVMFLLCEGGGLKLKVVIISPLILPPNPFCSFLLTDVIAPRLQPTSASSSDRSVSSFSKIPSMTFPCPANNASGPLACTLLNGAS